MFSSLSIKIERLCNSRYPAQVLLEWLKLDIVIFVLVLIHIRGKMFDVRILTNPEKVYQWCSHVSYQKNVVVSIAKVCVIHKW